MPNIFMKTAMGRLGALAASFGVAAGLWIGLGGSINAAPPPPDPVTCLPTCEDTDGRFLVVAGNDPTTLSSQKIVVGLRFTEGSGDANFDIFDADPDETNWDVPFEQGDGNPNNNPDAPKIVIEIYADPGGVGGVGLPVASFTPGGVPGPIEKGDWLSYFPGANNTWTGLFLPQHPDALNAAGGYYQYAFHFSAFDPNVNQGWNAFKFRAQGTPLIIGKQVIGFLGGMNIPNDVLTIYPNFNPGDGIDASDFAGTTYDGAWTFQTNLPAFLQQVTMFDGDMDFGNDTCTYNDTDDPDSAGVPLFAAGSAAVAEGIAAATGVPASAACDGLDLANGVRTGLPSDDNSSDVWRRAPGIVPNGVAYQLKSPGGPKYPAGQTFLNENVSGNKEWEQFRIQLVDPGDFPAGRCPATGYPADVVKGYAASDCRTDELPGGPWEVQLRGMDLSNLNFFFFDFDFQPPNPNVYSIGRLVWFDADKDGVQDLCAGVPCAPELGIENVAYEVYDGPLPGGNLVRNGVTNAAGEFLEDLLPAGDYTVIIPASNFGAGQPLENLTSTTGGETQNGIEVGLPACTDVGVPAGCGEPLYNEALFGYAPETAAAVLIIDEDTIDEDKTSIKAISNGPPHCGGRLGGPGSPKICINEDIADEGQRTPLFSRPRDVTPVTGMMLPTGRVNDEGLFMFTLPDLQESAQNGAKFTISQFFFATGAAANENNLDKIKGVRPLNAADIYALEGKAVCAVVYDSDIDWDYKKVQANLKGATLGVTAFTVTDVTPHPAGGSYLPNIHLDLLPLAVHATVCDVSGGG